MAIIYIFLSIFILHIINLYVKQLENKINNLEKEIETLRLELLRDVVCFDT